MDGCCKTTATAPGMLKTIAFWSPPRFTSPPSMMLRCWICMMQRWTRGTLLGQKVELGNGVQTWILLRDSNDTSRCKDSKIRWKARPDFGVFYRFFLHQIPGQPENPSIPSSTQVSQRVLAFFEDRGWRGNSQPVGHGPKFWWHFLRILTFTDGQLVFVYIWFFSPFITTIWENMFYFLQVS